MEAINDFLIISDFDGTFIDFKNQVDGKIIKQIFCNHLFVQKIDRLAWKINDLGIFTNSMFGLKLRLLFYSVLTIFSEHLSYKSVIQKYEKLYKEYAEIEYRKKKWIVRYLEEEGFEFVILTNNKFAAKLNYDIVYAKSKRKYLKSKLPKYFLGDNYYDDYRNTPKGTTYINIGKNNIIYKLHLRKAVCIDNINEFIFF